MRYAMMVQVAWQILPPTNLLNRELEMGLKHRDDTLSLLRPLPLPTNRSHTLRIRFRSSEMSHIMDPVVLLFHSLACFDVFSLLLLKLSCLVQCPSKANLV